MASSKINETLVNDPNQLHIRETQFFISERYTNFKDQITLIDSTYKASKIKELSFKVCGYGYFQKHKKKLINNFLTYLNEAMTQCISLNRVKIIFNGFNVGNGQLSNIIRALKKVLKVVKGQSTIIRSLELCTTNLRDCKRSDFSEIFEFIRELGIATILTCEEINVQMADWEFLENEGKYLTYDELKEYFEEIAETAQLSKFKFKKFRLELSSCYMDMKSAYTFLKGTLKVPQLLGQLIERPVEQANGRNNIRNGTINAQAIQFYLQNFDDMYLNPVYSVKKSDPHYSENQKEAHEMKMDRMAKEESYINNQVIKHPKEFVMQLRVNQFHKKMMDFVSNLLGGMPLIHEFHIDFRNWNAMFQMPILQKSLEKKVITSKQEVSYMSKRNFKPGTQVKKQDQSGQGIILKTIYIM